MFKKESWVINTTLLIQFLKHTIMKTGLNGKNPWYSKNYEKSTDLPKMSALEGDDEKVKEGKRLKISTPNKYSIFCISIIITTKKL